VLFTDETTISLAPRNKKVLEKKKRKGSIKEDSNIIQKFTSGVVFPSLDLEKSMSSKKI